MVQSRPSRSLVRLGEYELVRRIATGGMAEVYEARRPGPRGFAKRVAASIASILADHGATSSK